MSAEWTRRPPSTCASGICSFSVDRRVGVVVDGGVVVVVDVGLGDRDGRSRLTRVQRVVVEDDVGRHQLGQAGHRRRLSPAPTPRRCRWRGRRRRPGRVVGHGSVTAAAGRCTVRPSAGVTAGAGSGAHSRTPAKAPAADHEEEQRQQDGAAAPVRAAAALGDDGRAEWRPCSGGGRAPAAGVLAQRVEPERRHHERWRRSFRGSPPVQPVELFGGHQDGPCLGSLAGPDDTGLLEQVHEPTGAGETDAQLALQHGGGAELRAHHEVAGLREQLVVVVAEAVAPRRAVRRPLDPDDGLGLPALARASGGRRRAPPPPRPRGPAGGAGCWRTPSSSSMSPLPIRRSAPGWSRMTRLSASEETEKAMRLGMLALITPGDDVDRRALGGDDQVDADGAGHLGDPHDGVLDVAGRHHHEVVQLVDDRRG